MNNHHGNKQRVEFSEQELLKMLDIVLDSIRVQIDLGRIDPYMARIYVKLSTAHDRALKTELPSRPST